MRHPGGRGPRGAGWNWFTSRWCVVRRTTTSVLRLAGIEDVVTALLDRLQPDQVAVERVFSQHNVRTATGTAQAAGKRILAAHRRGLPVASYTPSRRRKRR